VAQEDLVTQERNKNTSLQTELEQLKFSI